ncbi:MAG TPA: type II toxin-antitoxin system PemK/MazF family toxin [Pseudolabrys sp.]|nr:type II toxin-antitoxin system PemK/MazF family toxin [Pseudolabrys sp.]
MPYDVDGGLDAGEIIWVDFGRPFGHEQAGRRPALVISPRAYNERSSLILVCPITRNLAPWPFKVDVQGAGRIAGTVLVDQVRSIDRQARFVRRAEAVNEDTLNAVYGVLAAVFGIPVSN